MGQQPADLMISHWWWRAGWSPGKAFYTWHMTFDDGSPMAQLADQYRATLSRFPTLDVLSTEQLHMTIQGIGFTHEVDDNDLAAIIHATRAQLAELAAPMVEPGTPYVDAETVQTAIQPNESVATLRLALRRGIAAAWGAERVPESMDGFRPHVTLAYSNTTHDRAEVARAVGGVTASPARFLINALSLIRLHRDNAQYEWTEIAKVSVG